MKLIKYLKPFFIIILIIIGLLFVEATCELSLPDYMSKIVNNGIQQGGIENATFEVIRENEYNKIKLFLNDKDKKIVEANYKLLDKNNITKSEYTKYVSKYNILKKENIYILNTDDQKIIKKLSNILDNPILIVSNIESSPSGTATIPVPADVDPFEVLKTLPKEQLQAIVKSANEKLKEMPDSMITQASVIYIKSEYKAVGIDTDKLQSNYVLNAGLRMIALALISMVATVIVGFLAAKVAAGLGHNLRKKVFDKVGQFSNAEFDKFSTASLITRTTNDITQIQLLMSMLLRVVFYAPILGIGGVLKILNTDTSMGWIIGLALAVIFVIVIIMFITALPKFKIIQSLIDKLNLVTRESLTGVLVIRAFNTEKVEEKKFEKASKNLVKVNLFVGRLMSGMMPMMMLIMNIVTILIVWIGAHQVDLGNMQVGNMMAFIQYSMQILFAFLMITMVSIMLPRASISAKRVSEILETDITINDPKNKEKFDLNKTGYVEFNKVSFKYPKAEDYVLEDISFTAKPGQTTAFIGSTGCGKSTLINLIPRFYDVTSGSIKVDGVDVKKVTQKDLRDKIGYVPQKGVLFSGTIASNLKYGDEFASLKDLEIASEIAQAKSFILKKHKKFDTEITQEGSNVSGGQKQRLSIARAIVKKPEIYIFDDTFSALDFKTDADLRKALKAATSNSTVLIVAQRINTVKNADQIIVLEEGKIVGKGTHQKLLKSCKVYKEIALSQLSKEELA
ncbi:MAG: ABC transporter ATP-binding protein [Bacilli bacterium]|nr:ABC transporter ATP-binding protein [Bacilli bacterium]